MKFKQNLTITPPQKNLKSKLSFTLILLLINVFQLQSQVTDGDVIITNPSPCEITVSVETTDINCGYDGGSVVISLTGGNAPYYGGISPGIYGNVSEQWINENLAAGNYTYSFTDQNQCTVEGTFEILAEACCSEVTATTDTDCNEYGTATIVVTGGIPLISGSYVGPNGGGNHFTSDNNTITFTGLHDPGTYSYIVYDYHGCLSEGTFVIDGSTNSNCQDFQISETRGGDDTHGWETIFEGTSSVSTTLAFCFWTDFVPDRLLVRVNGFDVLDSGPWTTFGWFPTVDHICPGDFSQGQGPFYGQIPIEPCDEIEILVDGVACDAGELFWELDVSCGDLWCLGQGSHNNNRSTSSETEAAIQAIDMPIGDKSALDIKVYPNPVHDILNIKSSRNGLDFQSVRIFDSSGKIVFTTDMAGTSDLQVNTNDFPLGIYFVEIIDIAGNKILERFAKAK